MYGGGRGKIRVGKRSMEREPRRNCGAQELLDDVATVVDGRRSMIRVSANSASGCGSGRGLVVNPEATRAQFRSAAVFGTSVARSGGDYGNKRLSSPMNFQDYSVARINEVPVNERLHR